MDHSDTEGALTVVKSLPLQMTGFEFVKTHQVTSIGSSLLRHISRNIARSGVACRQRAREVGMYLCYSVMADQLC